MTIIVYRDGIMAADSAVFAGDRYCGLSKKIVRNERGEIAGAAGMRANCQAFFAWFLGDKGAPPAFIKDDGGLSALIVGVDGCVSRMDENGIVYLSMEHHYHVAGIGADIACGALELGATAEQAVRVACKINAWCREPITIERLGAAQ